MALSHLPAAAGSNYRLFVGLLDKDTTLTVNSPPTTGTPAQGIFFDFDSSGQWRCNVARGGGTPATIQVVPANALACAPTATNVFHTLRIRCAEAAAGQKNYARFYVDKAGLSDELKTEYAEITRDPTEPWPSDRMSIAVCLLGAPGHPADLQVHVDYCQFTSVTTLERS